MVRTLKQKQIEFGASPVIYNEYSGLSTDTKPTTGECTGSLFLEVDTGDVYAYDEVGGDWHKVCALGGDD